MGFLETPTDYLFFTGKGGVGKTALACATSLRLADVGKKVLLVSTDPASNLDEMLGAKLSNHPSAIPGAPGLFALNIDPELAAAEYRERVINPYRKIWTAAQIAELQEQLAGSCTNEIAAFDEFAGLLAGDDGGMWDYVIFDTAPTGHTLRLLSLPRAWAGFLESTTADASCLGPHAGLKTQQDLFELALQALTDGARTTVVLVTRPIAPRCARPRVRPASSTSSACATSSSRSTRSSRRPITTTGSRSPWNGAGARRSTRCPTVSVAFPPCACRCGRTTWSAFRRCARSWGTVRHPPLTRAARRWSRYRRSAR